MVVDFRVKDKNQTEQKIGRKRPEQKVQSNPKLVFGLLLATMILSGIFWLKSNLLSFWQGLMEPAKYEFINPEIVDKKLLELTRRLKTQDDVVSGIKELTRGLSGTYGVYVYELTKDKEYGIDEDEIFVGASLNKLPIMIAMLQEIEKGKLAFGDQYRLQSEDIQDYGTGAMRYDLPGTVYSYEDLLNLAGKKSDNTAAFVLSKIVGQEKVKTLLGSLKLNNTSMVDNKTTPKEMGEIFTEVYKGKLLGKGFRDKFYGFLTGTDFEDRIPMGVPDMVSVAHKIGTEIQAVNDCGIVFERNPYVLCILSKEAKEAEALEALPKISRLVWEYEK